MRDLEIRGAGNLLGGAQSGHIAAVGFDLYCELVTEAVGELKGEKPVEPFEVVIDLPIDAHLPREYVARDDVRMEAYRRLAAVVDPGRRRGHPRRVAGPLRPDPRAGRGAAQRGAAAGRVRAGRGPRACRCRRASRASTGSTCRRAARCGCKRLVPRAVAKDGGELAVPLERPAARGGRRARRPAAPARRLSAAPVSRRRDAPRSRRRSWAGRRRRAPSPSGNARWLGSIAACSASRNASSSARTASPLAVNAAKYSESGVRRGCGRTGSDRAGRRGSRPRRRARWRSGGCRRRRASRRGGAPAPSPRSGGRRSAAWHNASAEVTRSNDASSYGRSSQPPTRQRGLGTALPRAVEHRRREVDAVHLVAERGEPRDLATGAARDVERPAAWRGREDWVGEGLVEDDGGIGARRVVGLGPRRCSRRRPRARRSRVRCRTGTRRRARSRGASRPSARIDLVRRHGRGPGRPPARAPRAGSRPIGAPVVSSMCAR